MGSCYSGRPYTHGHNNMLYAFFQRDGIFNLFVFFDFGRVHIPGHVMFIHSRQESLAIFVLLYTACSGILFDSQFVWARSQLSFLSDFWNVQVE